MVVCGAEEGGWEIVGECLIKLPCCSKEEEYCKECIEYTLLHGWPTVFIDSRLEDPEKSL